MINFSVYLNRRVFVMLESSLCAQLVAKEPRFLHAGSDDSDQTMQMPRLI